MDLDSFLQTYEKVENLKLVVRVPEAKIEENLKIRKTRGNYRSYTPAQIQELLDLVIGQGMSPSQAGLTVGIVVRTTQYYVKLYRDDNERQLSEIKKRAKR